MTVNGKTAGRARQLCHSYAERGAPSEVSDKPVVRFLGQDSLKQVSDTVITVSLFAKGFAGTTYCGPEHKDADWRAGAMFCKPEQKSQFADLTS